MLQALSPSMFQGPSLPMLWGPMPSQPQGLAITNKQPHLTRPLAQSCPVDISQANISRYLYWPTTGHSWSLNTVEFDYRWDIVRSGAFQRNAEQREAVILWLAKYIVAVGERTEWVATLGVSPTKANNQLTWDRAVMVAALVVGVDIDFVRMLLAEIHEKAFKTSTTYPFPCLIFQLCKDFGVPIWHCDREPQVEVPPLGADLADTVGQSQGDDPIIPYHSDTFPASSSQAASMAPSSSRQPWMQKSIAESEARIERRMEGMMDLMDRKVQAVNKNLDAFELGVLE
ncbi:hypothetical protein H5410_051585 [Solanum commersonii]|uniref:Putative plant transposon protein domain-containing protein n=1 Tax=Solanum commersonii TaxID=4109 RepID=A0A9J5X157_SOLCO|nr:hypothetical protein H5410_051585 [Solanum commersonii]